MLPRLSSRTILAIIAAMVAIGSGFIYKRKSEISAATAGVGNFLQLFSDCYKGKHPSWCEEDLSIVKRNLMIVWNELPSPFTATADQIIDRYSHQQNSKDNTRGHHHPLLAGKVAVVTGATGGIGEETARVLLKHGCHVVLAVRNVTKGNEVLETMLKNIGDDSDAGSNLTGKGSVMHLDVSDLKLVDKFETDFRDTGLPLHYLILNAGIMAPPTYKTSKQGYEMQFATNYLGHFHLTRKLEDILLGSGIREFPARVIFVSSEVHTLWKVSLLPTEATERYSAVLAEEIPPNAKSYHPLMNYAFSKALMILCAKELQRRWGPESNAIAVALHPGIIETSLVESNPALEATFFRLLAFTLKSIAQGASTTVYAVVADEVVTNVRKNGASYFANNRWTASMEREEFTEELGKEAWELSSRLVDS